jgi:signal transduction histidine kinase
VVPSLVVAALGFVSLQQWARSSELLFEIQARDTASMAAEKADLLLRGAEDEILRRVRTAVADGADAAALDALVAATPLVKRLYLIDRSGRTIYPIDRRPGDADVLAALDGAAVDGLWERGGRRHVLAGDHAVLASVVDGPRDTRVLAAILCSEEVLRREVFEATFGGLEASTIVAVLDHLDRPVYSRGSLAGAHPVLSVPLRAGPPRWRVALYQPAGSSARASVRRQLLLFTVALGGLVLVIGAAALVTYRLTRREAEVAQLKADFVANVSHDLKTPLSVIRMFAETLELGRVNDEGRRREYFRVIARESERLSRLIDNVLNFSRIEAGRRTYEREPTAIEPLVRDVLDAFAYPLAQRGFKVEVDVAPGLPEAPLDADAVGQALANLIDNAIKYSDERCTLRVDARVVDGQLALSVADDGIGIHPEEHARIFDKFYRVGRSDTQGRRGSGVGLALVRHVAEAHHGRVTVESEPGRGSRFTLWLPLV